MRIEVYFEQLRDAIDASPIISSFNVTYDKRGSHEGFIHGELYFKLWAEDEHYCHMLEIQPGTD